VADSKMAIARQIDALSGNATVSNSSANPVHAAEIDSGAARKPSLETGGTQQGASWFLPR